MTTRSHWLCIALLSLGCTAPGMESVPPATPPASQPESRVVKPFAGITVRPDEKIIEIDAVVCLDEGWLEQIACGPASREHESLVVIESKPSEIHAALLLAGYESGTPGRWVYTKDEERIEPPTGDKVDVFVSYLSEQGETIEEPISNWIRDHNDQHEFPDIPWVFGGSGFAPSPEWMGEGEYYIADQTGSIIGLVTFGDEVLGFTEVLSGQVEVSPAVWEVQTDAIPALGTKVKLIIKPAKQREKLTSDSDD